MTGRLCCARGQTARGFTPAPSHLGLFAWREAKKGPLEGGSGARWVLDAATNAGRREGLGGAGPGGAFVRGPEGPRADRAQSGLGVGERDKGSGPFTAVFNATAGRGVGLTELRGGAVGLEHLVAEGQNGQGGDGAEAPIVAKTRRDGSLGRARQKEGGEGKQDAPERGESTGARTPGHG